MLASLAGALVLTSCGAPGAAGRPTAPPSATRSSTRSIRRPRRASSAASTRARRSRQPATTPAASGSPTTTSLATGAPSLVDWGARLAEWNANHEHDPDVPNGTGYWPRLANGLDSYASVRVVGGRVLDYVLNLYPALTTAQAVSRVEDELPPSSAVRVEALRPSGTSAPGCEVLVLSGPVLQAKLGRSAMAELETAGANLQPASITRIVLSPAPRGGALPASCSG